MAYIFEGADKLRNQGQSLEAAEKYQEIARSSEDQQIIGAALHMTAVCFNQAGEHAQAEEFFAQAIKHYQDLVDTFNLARVKRDFGNCQMAQGKLAEAREALSDSIQGFKQNKDAGELAMTQSKLAALMAKQEEHADAQSMAYEAIQFANKSNNKFYVATAYKEAGRVYFLGKKYEAMIDCLYAALGALELEEDSHAKQHAELYLSLSFAYRQLENTELSEATNNKAEEYLKQLDEQSANRIRGYFK